MEEDRTETEEKEEGVISQGGEFLSNQRFRKFQTAHSLQEGGVNVSGQNTPGHPWAALTERAATQQPPAQTNVPQRTGHAKPLGAQSRMFRVRQYGLSSKGKWASLDLLSSNKSTLSARAGERLRVYFVRKPRCPDLSRDPRATSQTLFVKESISGHLSKR